MTEKEIIAIFEKAMDKALNEDKIKGLVSDALAEKLKAIPAQVVGTGGPDDPNLAKANDRVITLSEYLGDVRRAYMGPQGGPLKYYKADNGPDDDKRPSLIKCVTGVDPEYLRHVAPEIAKALYEGTTTAGGYLVPTEESRELINLMDDKWSVIPGLCRQVPMRTNQITFPTLTGGVTVYWIPETTGDKGSTDPSSFEQQYGWKPPSSPTFGQLSITAHVAAVKVAVSNQLLDDSDPEVNGVLRDLFGEALGEALDVACLQGTGAATDPITGLDNRITTNVLAAGANFNFDDVINLIKPIRKASKSPLPVQLLGNVDAETSLMKVKDNNGNYIYKGPREDGLAPRIWGQPFYANENILSTYGTGSNETRMYAGRFGKDAFLGRRQGVVVKTNPWANPYFDHNQTVFLAEFRMGFSISDESRFAWLDGIPVL